MLRAGFVTSRKGQSGENFVLLSDIDLSGVTWGLYSNNAIIDGNGISELIGIGPAHTPGLTVFKNIKEVKNPICQIIWI